MDLAKLSPEMAKISPNLKNLVEKCSISRSDQVSSGFGRRSETEPMVSVSRELDPLLTTKVVAVGPSLFGFTGWVRPPVELDNSSCTHIWII